MSLQTKILAIQSEVQKVSKGGTNTFSKYDYARLGDVLDPIRPLLQKYKLSVIQSVAHIKSDMVTQDNGYYTLATVQVTTTVTDIEDKDEGSNTLITTCPGFSLDKNGDKAMYKAITGARKYAISCLFLLDWDAIDPEDSDHDENRFKTQQQSFKRKGVF